VLVNPLLMATDYISHFDRQQTPEHTAGREGYVWFNGIQGDQNSTLLQASIRDFDLESFHRRKQQIGEVAQKIAAQYPTARWNFTSAIPTATSAMPSAKTAAPLI
jgi:tripeptide aminopeptidase